MWNSLIDLISNLLGVSLFGRGVIETDRSEKDDKQE